MSEQEAPPVEDTPTTDADTQAEVDWRQRYENLQPEYTRKTQRLSELENDREAWMRHGQEHWPDLFEADEEPEPEFEEEPEPTMAPEPKPDTRIEWLVAREAERQFERDLNRFAGDRDLPEGARGWIEAHSMAHGHDEKSLKNAVEAFFQLEDQVYERRAQGLKKAKKAPHVPAAGKAGTQVPDLDDPVQRVAYMNARYADLASD